MSYKIVHTLNIPGKDLGERFLESLDVKLIKGLWQTEDEFINNAGDADAVLGDIIRKPFTHRVIEHLSKCRIIAGIGLGFEAIDLEAATERGIVVTNVPDYCLDEVSGRAIALMLALGYKVLQIDKAVKERQVNMAKDMNSMLEVAYPIFRIRGQTLGIIGISKIGTATALKAKGLGMRVIAHDPYVFGGVVESLGAQPVDMDTLLKESDFVSLHVPFMPETKGLIGYREFKKMKPTCYFINTSRGGCVDEPGLIRALQEEVIAGAGLDVTVDEPMAKDNPLTKMPNVILTGHSAWYSTNSEAELFAKPMSQVALALKGKWPPYAINPEVRREWLDKWG